MGTYNHYFKPKASICPVLRGRFDLKDNLPKFRSISLILYNFNGFYKIIMKIKVIMPKYFCKFFSSIF